MRWFIKTRKKPKMINENLLLQKINKSNRIAITGHIHPDGDCTGAVLGMYNYILDNAPEKNVKLCLEIPSAKFSYLRGFELIGEAPYLEAELLISLDAADRERLGVREIMLDTARDSICIDHHITNTGFARDNVILPGASSTCEVLYGLMDPEKISKETAACLYTGIIHDTGVFKYSNTSPKTMEIAGALMGMGIDFGSMIEDGFYARSFVQNKLLGLALDQAQITMEGRCLYTQLESALWTPFTTDSKELDGITGNIMNTQGVEVGIFLYETAPGEWKLSLRSKKNIDVSRIAADFGGGGHVKAAGATLTGLAKEEVLSKVLEAIKDQERVSHG